MTRIGRIVTLTGGAALAAAALLFAAEAPAKSATATLAGPEGSVLTGTVTFSEMAGQVMIEASVENAPPGEHGFHLHEKGDCSAADFTSAGGHFNPTGEVHGAPDAPHHHAGDFGNITVGEDGKGKLLLHSTMLTLDDGPSSAVGRAVILHAGADDLTSQPSGAAGARIACGVVR